MRFDEQKATAIAAYFLNRASGREYYLKLMKLMYLAEREAIRRRNVGITFDRLVSMANGPVLSETLKMLTPREEIEPAPLWREHIGLPEGFEVILKKPFPFENVLSESEIAILDSIWSEFGSWDRWKLVEYTHTLPEWKDPAGSSKAITFQDLLASFELPPEDIQSRYAEHRAAEAMDQVLSGIDRE